MKSHDRRRTKRVRDRGGAAVEFSLLLMPLVVLVFGIIDFGRAYNAQITLTQAAREGARLASFPNNTASYVQSKSVSMATGLTGVSADTPVMCSTTGTTETTEVVRYTFNYITPLASLIPGLPTTLTGTGHMPC